MSEFALIDRYFRGLTPKNATTRLGVGDDCALSAVPKGHQLVSCIDTLIEDRHFPKNTDPYAIAHKAVAVNLSDLASMGATPFAILLGLSLPKSAANDAFLRPFCKGLGDVCKAFDVELIGGDTTQAPTLTLSVCALGHTPTGQAVRRGGAKVGDWVCLSGPVGSASLALEYLLAQKDWRRDMQKDEWTRLRRALDTPTPCVRLGQKLRPIAHAMIDVSDGFAQDLGHILQASGVGAAIHLDRVPCQAPLLRLPALQRYRHILGGGDDYQLCVCVDRKDFAAFDRLYPNRLFVVGEITAESGLRLFENGNEVHFDLTGWNHF